MRDDPLGAERRRAVAVLPQLRALLDATAPPPPTARQARFGVDLLDACVTASGLTEILAAGEADVAALDGFALGLALRLTAGRTQAGSIVRVRQDFLDREGGAVNAPGLVEIGVDPDRVTLVRVRDAADALQAGLDAARCRVVGAVMIELWGEARVLDATAGRRLLLAARDTGGAVLLTRVAARPEGNAVESRWRVAAAPSRPAPAGAPGRPSFALELLKGRGEAAGQRRLVEWDRDRGRFEERRDRDDAPLSRPLVPDAPHRSGAAARSAEGIRRAG